MNNFNLALLELRSIAEDCPVDSVKINIAKWIDKYIGECHMEISEYRPFNKDHANYNLESAMKKLGEVIAKNSNMYPSYVTDKDGFQRKMRISSLYFKNEFGK